MKGVFHVHLSPPIEKHQIFPITNILVIYFEVNLTVMQFMLPDNKNQVKGHAIYFYVYVYSRKRYIPIPGMYLNLSTDL